MTALTPAEALVLMEPNGDDGRQAVKLTLLAMVLQGMLLVERSGPRAAPRLRLGNLGGTMPGAAPGNPWAQPGSAPMSPPPDHVAAVLDAVRASSTGLLDDVARILSGTTRRFATFIPELVRPGMARRGLLGSNTLQEQRRMLFFFKRTVSVTNHFRTPEGEREYQRLRALLDSAPAIREHLDSDPRRAAVMAVALGALIVMLPSLLPLIGPLGATLNPQDFPGMADGGAGDSGWTVAVEESMDSMSGAVDGALSDAESSSDSSDSDGGDGGGSDGGGE